MLTTENKSLSALFEAAAPMWANSLKLPGSFSSSSRPKQKLLDKDKNASGAWRFTPTAGASLKPDKETLKRLFPEKSNPQNLGKGLHSSKYDTIVFNDPTGKKRYIIWQNTDSKTPAILEDQKLGYICENGLAAGINGQNPSDLIRADKRVSALYNSLSVGSATKEAIDQFANRVASVSARAASKLEITGVATVGVGGTDIVDVTVAGGSGSGGSDLHVKFNDDLRLIGLQRLSNRSNISVNQKLLNLLASPNFKPDTKLKSKLANLPATTEWKISRDRFAREVFGLAIKQLTPEQELELYRKYRKQFLEYLNGDSTIINLPNGTKKSIGPYRNVRDALEKRLQTFLIPEESDNFGKIYFFNFNGSATPNDDDPNKPMVQVGLTVKEVGLTAKQVTLKPRDKETDTNLYSVIVTDEENKQFEIARVEMRTSGQGHPPQIKNVKGTGTQPQFAEEVFSESCDRSNANIKTISGVYKLSLLEALGLK